MNDSVGNSPVNNPLAWVNGSDAPEKSSLDLGFMALTDCASLVVAATQGFAQPYGLTLNLKRQSSWANLRDKLVSGELDAAHSLYGLIYAVHLGIGGVAPTDMAVLMGLNQNGQSINLSHGLQQQGVTTPEALDRHAPKPYKADVRPDISHRHPRHVAVLLAGEPRHSPVARCRQCGGAAAADDRAPASRAHRRLLCR